MMKTRIPLLDSSMLLGLILIASLTGFYRLAWAANSPQAATARYLAPTGSDVSDCTNASAPCQTIQYAVNHSAAGDELRLASSPKKRDIPK
jgi:hypothetical protein